MQFNIFVRVSAAVGFATCLSILGCATNPVTRKATSDDETFVCRSRGMVDDGFTVKIAPGTGNSLRGTIAAVNVWGTDQPFYDGDFSIELNKKSANVCTATLKGDAAGVKSPKVKDPTIIAEGDGRVSTLILKDGGTPSDLACDLPQALKESLQRCGQERLGASVE